MSLVSVYSMFYAVLLGVMLCGLSSFKPFPWGFMSEDTALRKSYEAKRLLCSLFLLNIVPFLIFGLGYNIVKEMPDQLSPVSATVCGLMSLAVFAPYRIYHIVLFSWPLKFYDQNEWDTVTKERGIRPSLPGHILAITFYIIPWVLGLFLAYAT